MIENNTKSSNDKSSDLISYYSNLKNKIKEYFTKVDENLILDILRIQSKHQDWIGSTTLEIQYVNDIDLNKKKEKLYDKYNMLPIEKNDRTLRFKAKGMYLQNIEELLDIDSEIVFINGEAEVTEEDQYPSTH
ncbi:MAG TPA: hypothetical protein VFR65_03910 [Nitrososphaeraceae archaeon]|nr:hypothetical protein [Nitrososphaeraceae archaeon]